MTCVGLQGSTIRALIDENAALRKDLRIAEIDNQRTSSQADVLFEMVEKISGDSGRLNLR